MERETINLGDEITQEQDIIGFEGMRIINPREITQNTIDNLLGGSDISNADLNHMDVQDLVLLSYGLGRLDIEEKPWAYRG
ncbi:MAG: hypothetical protein KAK00_07375 [Nanoarchaeota archaeon]|nr:hypothetical protein [Nanoarchaeota archaeon]